jgi:glycine oxidase
VEHADVIILGGGVIGLMLTVELRDAGADVLLLERGQTGREASWAAGGMLACSDPHLDPQLRLMAAESAALYPGWAARLLAETGVDFDLRTQGAILLHREPTELVNGSRPLSEEELSRLEPKLAPGGHGPRHAQFAPESSVDPRLLMQGLRLLAERVGVRLHTGEEVLAVESAAGRACGVRTQSASYSSGKVINCAGAWAGQIQAETAIPTHPVKGHMLALPDPGNRRLQHVVRSPEVYLIPRSGGVGVGRVVIGATVENAGFDKRVDKEVIHRLHMAALRLLPALAGLPIAETWTGLRPGSPDGLPLLGETSLPGYYTATGLYRDGILLAPATSKLVATEVLGSNMPDTRKFLTPQRVVVTLP